MPLVHPPHGQNQSHELPSFGMDVRAVRWKAHLSDIDDEPPVRGRAFQSLIWFLNPLQWWQMKSLRRWGAVARIVSAVAAAGVATRMHAVLSR